MEDIVEKIRNLTNNYSSNDKAWSRLHTLYGEFEHRVKTAVEVADHTTYKVVAEIDNDLIFFEKQLQDFADSTFAFEEDCEYYFYVIGDLINLLNKMGHVFAIRDREQISLCGDWCLMNIKGKFFDCELEEDFCLFVIMEDEDALAFKLRWG